MHIEDANPFLQILDGIPNVENFYELEFLKHPILNTFVLKVTIFKTNSIVRTTDNKIFVRKGAQSLPVDTIEKIRRWNSTKVSLLMKMKQLGNQK